MKKKNLVKYYNLYFNGEIQDLMEIRKKYSFNKFKINSFMYTCLSDALEYAVRFGRKYKKEKDLLKEINKIEYQLTAVLKLQLESRYTQEQKLLYKLKKNIKKIFHLRTKKHFLIEVSKNAIRNELVIHDAIYRNFNDQEKIFYSAQIAFLISDILTLNIKGALYWCDVVKKTITNTIDIQTRLDNAINKLTFTS